MSNHGWALLRLPYIDECPDTKTNTACTFARRKCLTSECVRSTAVSCCQPGRACSVPPTWYRPDHNLQPAAMIVVTVPLITGGAGVVSTCLGTVNQTHSLGHRIVEYYLFSWAGARRTCNATATIPSGRDLALTLRPNTETTPSTTTLPFQLSVPPYQSSFPARAFACRARHDNTASTQSYSCGCSSLLTDSSLIEPLIASQYNKKRSRVPVKQT